MKEGGNEHPMGGTGLPKLNDRSKTSWNPGILVLVGISVHKKGAGHSVCTAPFRGRNRGKNSSPRDQHYSRKEHYGRGENMVKDEKRRRVLTFTMMFECLSPHNQTQLPRMLRERENFIPSLGEIYFFFKKTFVAEFDQCFQTVH